MPPSYPKCDLIHIRWPDLAPSVSREANSGFPVNFKVFINNNGAVSHNLIDTSFPAASYTLFFDALTKKLNQSFIVGDNSWLPSCLARTDLPFAIPGRPIKAHTEDDADLCDLRQPSISNSHSVHISKAPFRNPA